MESQHIALGGAGTLVVFVTAALIFAADIWAERLRDKAPDRTEVGPTYYVLKLAYILLPLIMLGVLLLIRPDLAGPATAPGPAIVTQLMGRFGWSAPPVARDIELIIVFAVLTGFIIVTDMVGSPYQMLDPARFVDDPEVGGEDLREGPSGRKAIRRSFFVDAGMMILKAVFNVPPSVYYAENHILENFHARSWVANGRPAYFYAAMLVAAALATVFLQYPLQQFQTLSSLLVAPVLFIVGVQVIAHALRAENRPHPAPASPPASGVVQAPLRDELEFLPTALIIILTPVDGVGLEWSLPLGITCHLLRSWVLRRPMKPTEWGIGIGALVALMLMLVARFAPAG